MNEYLIQKVSVGSPKPYNGKKKSGTLYNVVITIDGKTYFNTVFDDKALADSYSEWAGKKARVILYDEEYNGKTYAKWKEPTKIELLEARIEALEKFARVSMIEMPILKDKYLGK